MGQCQAAVAAGAAPAAFIETINEAQADRAAAQAELDNAPEATGLDRVDVSVLIDSLGDVGGVLTEADRTA